MDVRKQKVLDYYEKELQKMLSGFRVRSKTENHQV